MRLSEIREIISDNIDQLICVADKPDINGYILMKNIQITVEAIENLATLTFLEPFISQLQSFENIYYARMPAIKILSSEFDSFRKIQAELQSHCKTIIALADSIILPMETQTICIKLHETTNISDVKKLIINLDEIFSQTSNLTNYKGSVKFAGFEAGTNWINLIVEGVTYIPLVYMLINAAYNVVRDYNSYKLLHQRYQSALTQNQVNNDLKDLVKAMSSEVIKKLAEKENLNLVQDEIERLVHCTVKLSTTIIDGNKVLASLTAPPEQQSKLKEAANQITSQLKDLKLLASPESVSEQAPTDNEPVV